MAGEASAPSAAWVLGMKIEIWLLLTRLTVIILTDAGPWPRTVQNLKSCRHPMCDEVEERVTRGQNHGTGPRLQNLEPREVRVIR